MLTRKKWGEMQIYTNEKLITRYALISKVLSTTGILVLLSGLAASFLRPEWYSLPFYTLILGFMLSNIGMFLANRYVREPRPDLVLRNSMKGLDNRYLLYQYHLPAQHAIFTPSGIYAVTPKFQGGMVEWNANRKRFRHRGVSMYRKIFGQESLGQPIIEAQAEAQRLAKFLNKKFGDDAPEVHPIILFTNPKIEFENIKETPIPVLKAKRLNAYLRKQPHRPTLSDKQIKDLEPV